MRMPWRAVNPPPLTFAVMPGRKNVMMFGTATMEQLGIDLYPLALETPRALALAGATRGGELQQSCAAQRVTAHVLPFQPVGSAETSADAAVKSFGRSGPDVFVDPAEEQGARERCAGR